MKQGQSKLQSWVEVIFGTVSGLVVALLTQAIVFPLYGFQPTHSQHLQITAIFTVVSIVRSYLIRRLFNWWHMR